MMKLILTSITKHNKGAFLVESKHPIYWEVNFVYILNNLLAANDTENVNEVRRCPLLANGRENYRQQSDHA